MTNINYTVSIQVTNGPKVSPTLNNLEVGFISKNVLGLPPSTPNTELSIDLPKPGDIAFLIINPNVASDIPDPALVNDAQTKAKALDEAKTKADADKKLLQAAKDAEANAPPAAKQAATEKREAALKASEASSKTLKEAQTAADEAKKNLDAEKQSAPARKITYTVNNDATKVHSLDAPLLLIGPGAVKLLGDGLDSPQFKGLAFADVIIEILLGYTKAP